MMSHAYSDVVMGLSLGLVPADVVELVVTEVQTSDAGVKATILSCSSSLSVAPRAAGIIVYLVQASCGVRYGRTDKKMFLVSKRFTGVRVHICIIYVLEQLELNSASVNP